MNLIHPEKRNSGDRCLESVAVAVIFTMAMILVDNLNWQDADRRARAIANFEKVREAWDIYTNLESEARGILPTLSEWPVSTAVN